MIKISNEAETWESAKVIDITSSSALYLPKNVQINTASGPKYLANYPVKWTAIDGTKNFSCFGFVEDQETSENIDYLYPAVASLSMENGDITTAKAMSAAYFNNGSWKNASGKFFIPLGSELYLARGGLYIE